MANLKIEEMSGFSRDELLNQPVEVLVPERLHAAHLKHRTDFVSSPASRPMGLGMGLLARRKDGSEFPVEISLSPVETPKGLYVIAIVKDITERAELEERVLDRSAGRRRAPADAGAGGQ